MSQLVVALGLALLAGCGDDGSSSTPADPTAIVVESEVLFPVGDACHVRGIVRNDTATGTFDVVLRWQAFSATVQSLGTTRASIDNLRPGERRAYDATGFASNDEGLVRCSRIARFERIETSATLD